jgi:hypothetical protein
VRAQLRNSSAMNKEQSTDQQQIRVNDREQLIYLLTEAAEIEHGLMCTYLYAGWSLKRSCEEGLTAEQFSAVERWRATIRSVAMEEMVHLAMVNNMLMSIGSPPHFRRQNFPVPSGYHPSSLVVRLAPLTRDTLQHFIYLERPEGMEMTQAAGFETAQHYQRRAPRVTVTPTAEDYDTVGHLYRGIEDGFASLSADLGEQVLFLGHPDAQVGRDDLDLEGLLRVTDLASARKAVEVIIEQGEGGRRDAKQSHYARFAAMAIEYDQFLADDPGFEPCRPVADDPVMLSPIQDASRTHVAHRKAAAVLDLANACYGLMLRLLASGTGVSRGTEPLRKIELDGAIGLMHVIDKLAVTLTTLPVEEGARMTAGMNFHLPRSALALPQRHAGAALMAERASEIALALAAAETMLPQLGALSARLRDVAASLRESA